MLNFGRDHTRSAIDTRQLEKSPARRLPLTQAKHCWGGLIIYVGEWP